MNQEVDGSVSNGGIRFLGLLTIVFITLKLTGFIDWDWVWVLAPALLPVAFCGLIILVSGLYGR